jgi:hypothetical protein
LCLSTQRCRYPRLPTVVCLEWRQACCCRRCVIVREFNVLYVILPVPSP